MNINTLWNKMHDLEGETFHTATGLPFVIEFIDKEHIQPIREGHGTWVLSKNLFEKAITTFELGIKEFRRTIIGSSYVLAILTDKRISN